MPDRTSTFVTLATRRRSTPECIAITTNNSGPTASGSKRQRRPTAAHEDPNHVSFLRGSEYVANQLDVLGREVGDFANRSRNHSVFSSDVEQEMGVQTAQLQAQFTRIHEGLTALDRIRGACSSVRSQGQLAQHRAQVMAMQKLRVKRLAQTFQDTVQERAKALSHKEETLQGMFGHAGVRSSGGAGGGQAGRAPEVASPSPRERGTMRSTSSALSSMPSSTNNITTNYANSSNSINSLHSPGTPPPVFSGGGGAMQRTPFTPASSRFNEGSGGATLRKRHTPAGPSFAPSPRAHDMSNGTMQQQQQQQQQQKSNGGQVYRQERGQEVFQMEKQVSQLNELMIEFTRTVTLQGETVQNISGALEETDVHVEKGRVELGKYFDNISGNRQLILKIFVTLIIISMLFILLW